VIYLADALSNMAWGARRRLGLSGSPLKPTTLFQGRGLSDWPPYSNGVIEPFEPYLRLGRPSAMCPVRPARPWTRLGNADPWHAIIARFEPACGSVSISRRSAGDKTHEVGTDPAVEQDND
jgi:hypothetical protein